MRMKLRSAKSVFYVLSGCIAVVALVVALLGAVSHSTVDDRPWALTDIRGHLPDLQFALRDDHGQAVKAADYHGKIVLLYFGFAGCSTQCPATLVRLKQVLALLGGDAADMRVLFVTVNPAGDTPEMLRHYLAAFDARHMVGLTGDPQALAALAKRYRAVYPLGDFVGDAPHSNVIYLFDRQGRARLLATPEDSEARMVQDIERLRHERD